MNLKFKALWAFIAGPLFVVGCTPAKGPFLMVQMCLSNDAGVSEFVEELKTIAAVEDAEFIDNSRNAQRALKSLGDADGDRKAGSPLIDIRVRRKDGAGIAATNLGLPGYQMAMGFAEGSNATEAKDFANRVLMRLKNRWPVDVVPEGRGAMPLAGCR